ncbi:MAG: ribbon-helix-helix protein, CopG family [Victivallales bacterium]|nr:ribbon-helix-helix protein, CopG family [Victivallales bacterium]
MSKQCLTVKADEELLKALLDLKEARRTRNSSQIIREAIYAFHEVFFARDYTKRHNTAFSPTTKENRND